MTNDSFPDDSNEGPNSAALADHQENESVAGLSAAETLGHLRPESRPVPSLRDV